MKIYTYKDVYAYLTYEIQSPQIVGATFGRFAGRN